MRIGCACNSGRRLSCLSRQIVLDAPVRTQSSVSGVTDLDTYDLFAWIFSLNPHKLLVEHVKQLRNLDVKEGFKIIPSGKLVCPFTRVMRCFEPSEDHVTATYALLRVGIRAIKFRHLYGKCIRICH